MFLPIDQILIADNRQRREFDEDALRELGESIAKHGLFNAIVVRPSDAGWILVQGERRLRAIRNYLYDFGHTLQYAGELCEGGHVPVVPLSDLDPLTAEEAELEENIRRSDLTWQERAAANARLASLRTRQAESRGEPAPGMAAIAEEVRGSSFGSAITNTKREIIIAKHLHRPEVAKSKTLEDAWKTLKREEAKAAHVALADSVGRTFSSDSHTLIHANCVEWMVGQEDGQFDVILSDPPYGMDAQDFGDAGGRLLESHDYNDTYPEWVALMNNCAWEWYRLAKPMAHAYICCDFDRFHELKEMMAGAGWWVHRTPIINYKVDGNRVPWPEHGPQRKYELILYAVKGKKPTLAVRPDIIETRGDANLGHGAQKPVALFIDLLRRSASPGDSVLDTFAGTGTTVAAAHALKVRATAVEQSAASYGIALERVQTLKGE